MPDNLTLTPTEQARYVELLEIRFREVVNELAQAKRLTCENNQLKKDLNLVSGVATNLACQIGLDWETEVAIACNFCDPEASERRWRTMHKRLARMIDKYKADSERAGRHRSLLQRLFALHPLRCACQNPTDECEHCRLDAEIVAALKEPTDGK